MLGVIKLHRDAVEEIQPSAEFNYLKDEARNCWDGALAKGQKARLPQRAGHRARADRHDRLPDGLRHHRRRARHRAREIQTARRRRHVEDRQSQRAGSVAPPRLRARRKSKASSRTSRSTTRLKTSRKMARPIRSGLQAGTSAGVRLRVQAASRQAQHRLHGAFENDGRRAAVHQRRDFQDRQHAATNAPWKTSATPTSRRGRWA